MKMNIGTGIDIVACKRFEDIQSSSQVTLHKLFSDTEVAYCMESPMLSAQRFAVRYAAKEALVKAVCHLYPTKPIRLREWIPFIEVKKNDLSIPFLHIDWHAIGMPEAYSWNITLSLSHEKEFAIAVVIIIIS